MLKTSVVSFYPIGKVPKQCFEFFVRAIFTDVTYREVASSHPVEFVSQYFLTNLF